MSRPTNCTRETGTASFGHVRPSCVPLCEAVVLGCLEVFAPSPGGRLSGTKPSCVELSAVV
eukprot:15482501-Alexandrium_andersonii.AAC.1